VSAPDLEHIVKFFRLVVQYRAQVLYGRQELVLHKLDGGNVDGRRDNVVAGLASIDVVVRIRRGEIPNNLINIHVRRRSAAGLEYIDYELAVVLPARHFVRCGFNGARKIRRHDSHLPVDLGCRSFDQS